MKRKIFLFLITFLISITFCVPVFALTNSRDVLEIAVVFVATICKYGGILFTVFAICLFIMAIHNESGIKMITAKKIFITALIMLVVSMSLTSLVDTAIMVFNSIFNDIASVTGQ